MTVSGIVGLGFEQTLPQGLGWIDEPVKLMFTFTGVVIALVHDNGPPIEPSRLPLPAGEPLAGELATAPDGLDPEAWPSSAPAPRSPGAPAALLDDGEACSLPEWLADSARAGLWRAQRALTEQGALFSLVPPRLGGVSLRVALPCRPRPARTAA